MKNRLKVLRAERDWCQAQLAELLNVSRQTVNALETGKYDPSLPLAFKLGRVIRMQDRRYFQAGGRRKKRPDPYVDVVLELISSPRTSSSFEENKARDGLHDRRHRRSLFKLFSDRPAGMAEAPAS